MTHTPGGFIALLLVIAILLPCVSSPENEIVTESPQTVCGDSPVQSGTTDGNNTEKTIMVAVIVIIVIFIIYGWSQTNLSQGTDNQSHEWEVKAGWKLF
jgi:hypothetical protein